MPGTTHPLRQQVSSVVPEVVIDLFEVIQVQQEQSERRMVPTCGKGALVQAVQEQGAIREAGQGMA